jgi:hypothetical protein
MPPLWDVYSLRRTGRLTGKHSVSKVHSQDDTVFV